MTILGAAFTFLTARPPVCDDPDARDLERAENLRDELGTTRGLIVSWGAVGDDGPFWAAVSTVRGRTCRKVGATRVHAIELAAEAARK